MDSPVSTAAPAACPACAVPACEPAFTASDDALRAASGVFAYLACTACGTTFADPQPDDATLQAAYGRGYGNYNERRNALERLVEPMARREARRVARHAAAGTPMLEVGCGTGRFLERMAAEGWTGELRGAELSPDVAEGTGRRLGIRVDAAAAEEADLGSGELGVLVLRHVIEHLRDPGAFLERAHGALPAESMLYLATPDAHALSARVFGHHWWGYEVPRHLVIFSRDGLRSLLARRGFAVVDEWWGFAPQMWNASLYLALDRGRGTTWAPRAAHVLNPLITGPAVAAAAAEVALRRSTMYCVLARPV